MSSTTEKRQASSALGDKIMKLARELDSIKLHGSNTDARNFEEALTRIKGIAVRVQSGAIAASQK